MHLTMHTQYLALITLSLKRRFCAKASFSLLLILLGQGLQERVLLHRPPLPAQDGGGRQELRQVPSDRRQ